MKGLTMKGRARKGKMGRGISTQDKPGFKGYSKSGTPIFKSTSKSKSDKNKK